MVETNERTRTWWQWSYRVAESFVGILVASSSERHFQNETELESYSDNICKMLGKVHVGYVEMLRQGKLVFILIVCGR